MPMPIFRPYRRLALTAAALVAAAAAAPLAASAAPVFQFEDEEETILGSGVVFDATGEVDARVATMVSKPRAFDAAIEAMQEGLLQRGDLATVLALAPRIVEAQPNNARALRLYALGLAAAGRPDEARALPKSAGDGAPWQGEDVLSLMIRALFARDVGDLDTAEELAGKAAALKPDAAFAHNLIGTIAAARGDGPAALQAFEQAGRLAPGAVPFRANLAALRLDGGDVLAAKRDYDRLVPLAPKSCPLRLGRSRVMAALERHRARIEDIRACLDAQPDHGPAAAALIAAHVDKRDYDGAAAALTAYREALASPDKTASMIALRSGDIAAARAHLAKSTAKTGLDEAILAAAEGRYEAGFAALPPMTADAPLSARLFAAGLAVAAGKPDEATIVLAPLVADEDPAVAQVGAFLSFLKAAQSGQAGEAARHIEAADGVLPSLTFDGAFASGVDGFMKSPAIPGLAIGTAFLIQDVNRPAMEAFAKAGKADPEAALPPLMAAIAATHEGLGRDVASRFAAEAIRRAPDYYDAHLMLAETRLDEDPSAALLSYDRALALREVPSVVFKAALVAERAGEADRALAGYERAAALLPENYLVLNQLAWFLAREGTHLDQAEALAERARALQPGNAAILDTLGYVALQRGEAEDAVSLFGEALRASKGQNQEIRLHLAQALIAAGKPDEAAPHLETLAEGTGPFADAAAALRNGM